MKRIVLTFILTSFIIVVFSQSIKGKLNRLAEKYGFEVESLDTDSLFRQKYLLVFSQPVNHGDPASESFQQLVILSHLGKDRPVVFVTEGYSAGYALNSKYVNELSHYLQANQVVVEHRYFGASTPEEVDWNQLTVANAAADHHKVIEVLKEIYKEKWISTGISKGGQTTMYHRTFYPDDVHISVPYVAPLNFSSEDKRVYYFLDTVSTAACRAAILNYQRELLKNKDTYLPAFKKLASYKNLTYRMGLEKAFELTVLEYSFAFFQWGNIGCENIPVAGTAEEMITHLDRVSGLSWISNEGIEGLQSFFYQAMREIGFYGYDITPFAEWVSYTQNPTFEFTLPENLSVSYDPETMEKVDQFIRHKAERMLFIYGGSDPWSSTAVDLTRNTDSYKIVKKGGSHSTRIQNLDEEQKEFALETLQRWLEE